MPKLKTIKGAAKRFKLTASGRVKRSKAFNNHIMTSKNMNRKRRLRKGGMVAAVDEKNIKRLIPYL